MIRFIHSGTLSATLLGLSFSPGATFGGGPSLAPVPENAAGMNPTSKKESQVVVVREAGKPDRPCELVTTKVLPDGSKIYVLRASDNGETIMVEQRSASAGESSASARVIPVAAANDSSPRRAENGAHVELPNATQYVDADASRIPKVQATAAKISTPSTLSGLDAPVDSVSTPPALETQRVPVAMPVIASEPKPASKGLFSFLSESRASRLAARQAKNNACSTCDPIPCSAPTPVTAANGDPRVVQRYIFPPSVSRDLSYLPPPPDHTPVAVPDVGSQAKMAPTASVETMDLPPIPEIPRAGIACDKPTDTKSKVAASTGSAELLNLPPISETPPAVVANVESTEAKPKVAASTRLPGLLDLPPIPDDAPAGVANVEPTDAKSKVAPPAGSAEVSDSATNPQLAPAGIALVEPPGRSFVGDAQPNKQMMPPSLTSPRPAVPLPISMSGAPSVRPTIDPEERKLQDLKRTLNSADRPSQRMAAAEDLLILAPGRLEEIRKILMAAAQDDPAGCVRAVCVHCLSKLRTHDQAYFAMLEKALQDEDAEVREEVTFALKKVSRK